MAEEVTNPASETNPAPVETAKTTTAPEIFSPEGWTAPEGMEVDKASLDTFGALAKEHGLTKAQGEALLGLHGDLAKKAMEAQAEAWAGLQKQWQDEARADKDIGGSKLTAEVLPAIAKVLDQFGGPEVRQALDVTGAGNNPAIIKMLFKVANAITEGGAVKGNPVVTEKKSMASLFYPSMTETK